jgi:hypothetical protein
MQFLLHWTPGFHYHQTAAAEHHLTLRLLGGMLQRICNAAGAAARLARLPRTRAAARM